MNIIKHLNRIISNRGVEDIIRYFSTGEFPPHLNYCLRDKFVKDMSHLSVDENGIIKYDLDDVHLEYVSPDRFDIALDEIANSISVGINSATFYKLVCSKYFGIPRNDCYAFHKQTPLYHLTRNYTKHKSNLPMRKPHVRFATSLVDMSRYSKLKDNKQMRFIRIVMDLYDRTVWLVPMHNKTHEEFILAWRRCNIPFPKVLLCDEDFTGLVSTFLTENGVKKIQKRSLPILTIDTANALRECITDIVWLPHVSEFENQLNAKHKITECPFSVGDKVRIISHGDGGSLHTIIRIYLPTRLHEFPTYGLADSNGQTLYIVSNKKALVQFKQNEITHITPLEL